MSALTLQALQERLPEVRREDILLPASVKDIPKGDYMVYVLTRDAVPLIVGRGKRDRAKVIFDSSEVMTTQHIKSISVRLNLIYGESNASINRFIIRCASKESAKAIESKIHREFGGNTPGIVPEIRRRVLDGVEEESVLEFILSAALCSSFSGLADIRRWRKNGLISDATWSEVCRRLNLTGDTTADRRPERNPKQSGGRAK